MMRSQPTLCDRLTWASRMDHVAKPLWVCHECGKRAYRGVSVAGAFVFYCDNDSHYPLSENQKRERRDRDRKEAERQLRREHIQREMARHGIAATCPVVSDCLMRARGLGYLADACHLLSEIEMMPFPQMCDIRRNRASHILISTFFRTRAISLKAVCDYALSLTNPYHFGDRNVVSAFSEIAWGLWCEENNRGRQPEALRVFWDGSGDSFQKGIGSQNG